MSPVQPTCDPFARESRDRLGPEFDCLRLGAKYLNLWFRASRLFEHLVESKNLNNRIMSSWISFIKERFSTRSKCLIGSTSPSDFWLDKSNKAYYMTIVCNRWMSIRLDLLNNLIVLSSCIFAVLGRVHALSLVSFKNEFWLVILNLNRARSNGCWIGWSLHNLRFITYSILKFSYSAIGTSWSEHCFGWTGRNLSQCEYPYHVSL